MKTLNVLLVTYSFPPVGGVGVLRAASLARYLPSQDIRLDVLTARNASAVGLDQALANEIPDDVTVHRSPTLDLPFAIKKGLKKLIAGGKPSPLRSNDSKETSGKPSFLKRAFQDLLLPDPQVTWLPVLALVARRIVKQRRIDVVLITVPPFSCVLLVEKLRKQFPHLVIVMDFRDEWLSTTIGLVSFSRSQRALTFARNAEASAVKNATAVVAVTEAARKQIRARYPNESETKFHLVPNGFDATRLRPASPFSKKRTGDKIVVTYIGSIYASTDPTTLVEGFLSLPVDVRSRFHFRFIGYIEEPRFRNALLRLGDSVSLAGFLPKKDAIAAVNDSDYALLITHDPLNISAKFYDYVGAMKPILAVLNPGGDARRLLNDLRAGWWADSQDVAAIRKLFLDAVDRGLSPFPGFQPDLGKISQFERKVLAHRYADLLHSIAEDFACCKSRANAQGSSGPVMYHA